MHLKMKALLIVSSLIVLFPISLAAEESPAGSIKTLKGKGWIVRSGRPVETGVGTRVFRNDTLKTGADGSIAMVFKDDTLLSIGPDSRIVINDFLFSPAEGKLSIVTRLIKGTAAYLSGIIARLSPQSVRFETPAANVALRGTRFAVSVEGGDEE